MAVCFEQAGLQLSTAEKQKIRLVEKRLFSIPKRLFSFSNIIPTPEIYTQKRLGTVNTHFHIVEMFWMNKT